MRKHCLIAIAILAMPILLWVSGCSNSDETPTNGNGDENVVEIIMDNIAFSPADVTIDSGQTIVWLNRESVVHTATSGAPGDPTGMFDSGNMNNGDEYQFTFETIGDFDYFCEFHPNQMTGTITVQSIGD